jgi:acetyl esterase
MGLAFARRGFRVFNVNYRLAPENPYPAAIDDVCRAFLWLTHHADSYGADLSRVFLAGESAGANLATSLAIATASRRPEPFAREVFDTGVQPVGVLPMCGMFQVSDASRFARRRKLSTLIVDRVLEVEHAYLGEAIADPVGGIDLADPVCVLESDAVFERTLPPFLTAVGTRDPVLDDTRRLKSALDRRGVPCKALFYSGEIHAFHALLWRQNARTCWDESFRFVDEILGSARTREATTAAE